MHKGRHSRAALMSPVKRNAPDTFFRLCHHCLFLNESELEIKECEKCQRKFSLKKDQNSAPISEEEFFDQQMNEDEEIQEQRPPLKKTALTGLDVKW
ncbi:MAG: hypothetical protein ACKN9V_00450 [Pseudomonadota bacterium]